jgi:hypothetical protein
MMRAHYIVANGQESGLESHLEPQHDRLERQHRNEPGGVVQNGRSHQSVLVTFVHPTASG